MQDAHTRAHTHTQTLYRLIWVKDNVTNSNILRREMSCLFFKEERVLAESECLMSWGGDCVPDVEAAV